MRSPITRIVPQLPAPGPLVIGEAGAAPKTPTEHQRYLARIPALHLLEYVPPGWPLEVSPRLTVAAFNAERLKFRPAARALIDSVGAQVALLSEVDVGMARSGNAHTLRALADGTGEGWLYGVEYVELDLGDRHELLVHAGERNAKGFHGNAIVTRLALADQHLIPLEESGLWFPGKDGTQRRVGGRMALAARIAEARKPFWVVSVHLESKSDPQDRAAQMRALLRALDTIAPGAAMVIGGDLNTKALPSDPSEQARALGEPERWEPLFAELRAAGFSWTASNQPQPSQRTGPSGDPEPPFRKLDWILVRGVTAENPRVVPALDSAGHPISDHEMLAVDVRLYGTAEAVDIAPLTRSTLPS